LTFGKLGFSPDPLNPQSLPLAFVTARRTDLYSYRYEPLLERIIKISQVK